MKNLLLVFLFGLSAWVVQAQNNTLPSVQVKTLDGHSVNITDYTTTGKVTVVSFWATWCSPCKKELDAIAELYPDWQKDYQVQFLAITIDDARGFAKVKPMVDQKGWEYTILSDQNENLKRALNIQSIPYTLLLDKEGHIVYTHTGYVPGDEEELEKKIMALNK